MQMVNLQQPVRLIVIVFLLCIVAVFDVAAAEAPPPSCKAVFPGPNPFGGSGSIETPNSCNGGNCNFNGYQPVPNLQAPDNPDFSGKVFNKNKVSDKVYVYQTWKEKDNFDLSFKGTGTAVIYFTGDVVKLNKEARINVDGEPGNLLIVILGNELKIEVDSKINAFIYTEGLVTVEEGAEFNGAISGPGEIVIKKGGNYNYDLGDLEGFDPHGFCQAEESIDQFFEIIHDGTGLTCEQETITIRACTDSTCSATDTSINTLVNLVVNNEVPVQVDINNGINSNVQFSHVDPNTTAELSLLENYTCLNLSSATLSFPFSCQLDFADAGFIIEATDNQSCASQQFKIKAVKTDETTRQCIGALQGDKNINFSFGYILPSSGNVVPAINGVDLSSNSDTAISLSFNNASEALIDTLLYNDAGQISLSANYTETQGEFEDLYLQGGKDILLYPARLSAQLTKLDAANTPIDGATIERAGNLFAVDISAQCADGTTITANYQPEADDRIEINAIKTAPISASLGGDGILNVDGASILVSTAANNWQSANLAATDFIAGHYQNSNSSYSEVGLFAWQARDQNYGGYTIESTVNNAGRFTPHHFQQTVEESGDLVMMCGDWSYTGELSSPLSTIGAISYGQQPILKITPYNAFGGVTKNYINEFMMFSDPSGNVDRQFPITDLNQLGTENMLVSTHSYNVDGSFDVSTTDSGIVFYQFSQTDGFYYQRDLNALIAPFDAELEFTIVEVNDDDGISSQYLNSDNELVNDVESFVTSGVQIKFGRWRIDNTFGSEMANLDQPMHIEFYNGTRFVSNDTDMCTTFAPSLLTLVNLGDLDPSLTLVLHSAPGNDTFSQGYTDLLELKTPASIGKIGLTYDVPSWFEFDWSNTNTFDQNPTAVATFGVFDNTSDRIISKKEIDK